MQELRPPGRDAFALPVQCREEVVLGFQVRTAQVRPVGVSALDRVAQHRDQLTRTPRASSDPAVARAPCRARSHATPSGLVACSVVIDPPTGNTLAAGLVTPLTL